MPITATLLVCSCLCCSNPSGEAAMKHVSTIQQEVAVIKASSLSPEAKGKRLAPFIMKGMSIKDAEKIVGRSDLQLISGGAWVKSRWYLQFSLTITVIDGKVDSVGFLRRVP